MADTAPRDARPTTTLVRDVVTAARGHDLLLYAAGVTAFAAVGLVPLLLLGTRLAALVAGSGQLVSDSADLVGLVPPALGAQDSARWLVDRGAHLSLWDALVCLVPAGAYVEGVVRALDRLSLDGERGRRTWRGRRGSVVVLLVLPWLLLVTVHAARLLTAALGDGAAATLLGTYLAFLVGWLCFSPVLAVTYRVLAPQRPGPGAVLWGALGTSSVVVGFALGWVLFLRLGFPADRAYAGGDLPAALAVTALWLVLLHALVLLGYVVTLSIAARGGHPTGPVLRPSTVRSGRPARVSDSR